MKLYYRDFVDGVGCYDIIEQAEFGPLDFQLFFLPVYCNGLLI